jgi:copper chaperone NosL
MRSWLLILTLVAGCTEGAARPAAIDTANDVCRHCRMVISDTRLAAQIVAPAEEPLMFDDIGCLRDYLVAGHVSRDRVAWVADHRTGEWVPARRAVYTRSSQSTPMGSGILAHVDEASRDQDAAARGGQSMPAAAILGANGTHEEARE